MIVYLDDERRSYLNASKARTGKAVTELIRDAIDLHRDLSASAGRSTGKLAEALCALVDTMEPEELQQATKAIYAIREAYRAGREDMQRRYRQKYNDKAKRVEALTGKPSDNDKDNSKA